MFAMFSMKTRRWAFSRSRISSKDQWKWYAM